MIKVKDVLNYLCGVYPLDTACEFDNVGLLAGDGESAVTGAVVALDLDVTTLRFAKERGANLIITHHPVIFEPLKSVTEKDLVFGLIRDGISVISMHTNLDIGEGGVNDVLCDTLGLTDIKPYTAGDGYLLKYGVTGIDNPDRFAEFIKSKLGGAVRYVCGGKPIKTVLVCSGSGGGYISEAIAGGFDALVTADVKQHQFIEAINGGVSLFDGGHFNTENVIVEPLCNRLKKQFGDTEFTAYMPHNIKTV
ncbi:MAG: Nif3-like dinuclear metal center hexameric protein [Clostridia bacterium]|nr:Nif3-like dinuclear metal center hexameric protein [Clostridia bacterium]